MPDENIVLSLDGDLPSIPVKKIDLNIANSCEDDLCRIDLGGQEEKGIFKAFKDVLYNQLEVDRCACFIVGPFTALSNFTGKQVPYSIMKDTLEKLKNDGKFTPGVGGKLLDGASYATEAFNAFTGQNIKFVSDSLNNAFIIETLKSGSPISTGIRYGADYFKNEQDDGIVQDIGVVTGNRGHCITFIKANSTDDKLGLQIKFAENYEGVLKYNIIYAQFEKLRPLFFNTGVKYVF